MTRLTRIAFLTLAALLPGRVGLAQEAKIAIVDLQALTLGSDDGKKANDKLEKRYQEIAAIMQAASKSIEDKQNMLKTQERALSEARKAQLSREIDAEKKELTRKNEDYQTELADMEEQLMAPLMQNAENILSAYVKERGYTILLNISAENGNIVWFNRANDITPDVIKKINAEAKTAASTPAATPAKPGTPAQAPPK